MLKQKTKKLSTPIGELEDEVDKQRAIDIIKKVFAREMPKFAIYSTLDKNLLKMLLIKSTGISETEIV